MIDKKVRQLIAYAKNRMKKSSDPLHNLSHTKRVVENVKMICQDLNISSNQEQALILAAWWHDVSRTITKKPSFFWMLFLDDLLSASMLMKKSLKLYYWKEPIRLAIKLIFCKNPNSGSFFTKTILKKEELVLLDILQDADRLDIMHTERIQNIMPLGEKSKIYLFGYKRLVNYSLKINNLKFKTKAALKHFENIIKQLIEFMRNPEIWAWHIKKFGEKWCGQVLAKTNALLDHITSQNTVLAVS